LWWTYIDCSGLTASDTLTLTIPYAEYYPGLCGVVIDTDEADTYYETFYIMSNWSVNGFHRNPYCGNFDDVEDGTR